MATMGDDTNPECQYTTDDIQKALGISNNKAHIIAAWLNAADRFDNSYFINSVEAEQFSDADMAWYCDNWGHTKVEGPLKYSYLLTYAIPCHAVSDSQAGLTNEFCRFPQFRSLTP